jgi:hypothetical protein
MIFGSKAKTILLCVRFEFVGWQVLWGTNGCGPKDGLNKPHPQFFLCSAVFRQRSWEMNAIWRTKEVQQLLPSFLLT